MNNLGRTYGQSINIIRSGQVLTIERRRTSDSAEEGITREIQAPDIKRENKQSSEIKYMRNRVSSVNSSKSKTMEI